MNIQANTLIEKKTRRQTQTRDYLILKNIALQYAKYLSVFEWLEYTSICRHMQLKLGAQEGERRKKNANSKESRNKEVCESPYKINNVY